MNRALPLFLPLLALLLCACSRQRDDSPEAFRRTARDVAHTRCTVWSQMIPRITPAQLKSLCDCVADGAVQSVNEADLRAYIKDKEFPRAAEQVMHGVRNECSRKAGLD